MMTFREWQQTATLTTGTDLPQHAREVGCDAAYVYADDSFIRVVVRPDRVPRKPFHVHVGISDWWWYETLDAAEIRLWDEHAKDNAQ